MITPPFTLTQAATAPDVASAIYARAISLWRANRFAMAPETRQDDIDLAASAFAESATEEMKSFRLNFGVDAALIMVSDIMRTVSDRWRREEPIADTRLECRAKNTEDFDSFPIGSGPQLTFHVSVVSTLTLADVVCLSPLSS